MAATSFAPRQQHIAIAQTDRAMSRVLSRQLVFHERRSISDWVEDLRAAIFVPAGNQNRAVFKQRCAVVAVCRARAMSNRAATVSVCEAEFSISASLTTPP
jgi:hypothetical protein